MKILIVRPFPSVVNLKNNSYNQQEIGLATAFKKIGNDVAIVYYSNTNWQDVFQTRFGNIKIIYRKAKKIFGINSIFDDYTLIKKQYDLIITDEYSQSESCKICREYGGKTIIYHGPYYSKTQKKFNIFMFFFDFLHLKSIKEENPLIYTKSELAKKYLESKGLNVEKAIGVGLDISQLENNIDVSNFSSEIEYSDFNLLYIGVLEKRRNIIFLLKLLKRLIKIDERYQLIIVGEGKNKAYVRTVFDYIKNNGLGKNVKYVDKLPQNQLRDLYRKVKFFLLPTSYEIWGMVLMEALYFGNIVLTTYNGGSSSLLQQKNGFLLKLDLEEWFKIITLNKHLSELRTDYKKFNRGLIENSYNWDAIACEMLKGYKNHKTKL